MEIQTQFRGPVTIDEAEIYTFEDGLYGFPDSKRYAFIGELSPEFPYIWMQSVDEEAVVFILTNPFLFKENYDFELNQATVEALEIKNLDEAAVYSLVVIPENVQKSTINLKSPVIINLKNHRAKQVILNEDYPYKYYIFGAEGA